MSKLTDSHIHFIPRELAEYTSFYRGIWTEKEKLFEFLDRHQIEKALLVYPSTEAHVKLGSWQKVCDLYNEALSQIVRENQKIVAAGLVAIDEIASIPEQVKKLKEKGFRGISLASSYEGKFLVQELEPLWHVAAQENIFIFVHPQTMNPIGFERVKDPLLMPVLEYSFDIAMYLGLLMMEGILEKYNNTFIFSSLAGVMPFLKDRFDRVYPMLRGRAMVKDLGKLPSDILKKIYVDTSGSSITNIKAALELFGPDKLLWGSDYPVAVNVSENIAALDVLGKEVKEKITHGNLMRLLGPG